MNFSRGHDGSFHIAQLSTNWSCLFSTGITVILGLLLSWATGKGVLTRTIYFCTPVTHGCLVPSSSW